MVVVLKFWTNLRLMVYSKEVCVKEYIAKNRIDSVTWKMNENENEHKFSIRGRVIGCVVS